MDNEAILQKIENQKKLISDLTNENELLFQQFNHLMVRNNKLLKRIDDLQQLIDSLHLRIEELQLVNDNQLKINDGLRGRGGATENSGRQQPGNDNVRPLIDNLHRRIDELNLRNDVLQQRTSLLSRSGNDALTKEMEESSASKPKVNVEHLFTAWKNHPGQNAKNAPNLSRQMQMLVHLYENSTLSAAALFTLTGVNGVTGARYVGVLKKFKLIEYVGARKKGKYVIAEAGRKLVESAIEQ